MRVKARGFLLIFPLAFLNLEKNDFKIFIYMYMTTILTILFTQLFISCLAIILTGHITPLEYYKRRLGLDIESRMGSKLFIVNTIILGIRKLINCPSCTSFWITLIVMGVSVFAFKVAIITYIFTHMISNKINSVNL